jgi:septum formation protein
MSTQRGQLPSDTIEIGSAPGSPAQATAPDRLRAELTIDYAMPVCSQRADSRRTLPRDCATATVPDPMPREPVQLVLASASAGRLKTLRQAGLDPVVEVSGIDEECEASPDAASLVGRLATLKARAVASRLGSARLRRLVLGCDSALEFDGVTYGKPLDAAEAVQRWLAMRGGCGTLHTGHCVVDVQNDRQVTRAASTRVWFAHVSEAEIAEYVASGEPLAVAGAFTIDGLGGPFVDRVDGDPHNVVGLSLPLVRKMLAGFGVSWTSLWARQP